MQFAKSLLFCLVPLVLMGCQSGETLDVNPAESDKWELVKKVEGDHDKMSERFELNGNEALIHYDVESSKEWTHSSLKVFVGTGSENVWENPEVAILNHDHKTGTVKFHKPAGSYVLSIKPLEVHYKLAIYQKQ